MFGLCIGIAPCCIQLASSLQLYFFLKDGGNTTPLAGTPTVPHLNGRQVFEALRQAGVGAMKNFRLEPDAVVGKNKGGEDAEQDTKHTLTDFKKTSTTTKALCTSAAALVRYSILRQRNLKSIIRVKICMMRIFIHQRMSESSS